MRYGSTQSPVGSGRERYFRPGIHTLDVAVPPLADHSVFPSASCLTIPTSLRRSHAPRRRAPAVAPRLRGATPPNRALRVQGMGRRRAPPIRRRSDLPVAQPPIAQPPIAQPPIAQPPIAQPPIAQPPIARRGGRPPHSRRLSRRLPPRSRRLQRRRRLRRKRLRSAQMLSPTHGACSRRHRAADRFLPWIA